MRRIVRQFGVLTFKPRPDARIKLICFPYVGAHGYIFRTWHSMLPEDVEVSAVTASADAEAFAEDRITQFSQLVPLVSAKVAGVLDRPFVFYGHSAGAVLSFEIARWLRRHRGLLPRRLIVSGRRAPHMPDTEFRTRDKSDDEFVKRLAELSGTPLELLENKELLSIFLPGLRAEFDLCESYKYVDDVALPCPITAIGGRDDPESLEERLDGWRCHTSTSFSKHILDGNHFFIHSSERDLLDVLRTELLTAD